LIFSGESLGPKNKEEEKLEETKQTFFRYKQLPGVEES